MAVAFATLRVAKRQDERHESQRAELREASSAPARAEPSARGASSAPELVEAAQAYRTVGNWEDAIAALQQAIRLGAYDESLHYTLGNWMEAHATPADMVRYWSEEVKTDAKPQTAYYYWADGLARAGDDADALDKLAHALEIDPAHELSELGIAQILDHQGKHAEALSHCQTATRIFPDFRIAHEFCAKILSALGRNADAAHETTLAQQSKPDTPRRFVYWARYLAMKGRRGAAVAELQRALAQDPNDGEARTLLRELGVAPTAAPSAQSATPVSGAN
jgi:tetratricopeptide (TPR) repeat protein